VKYLRIAKIIIGALLVFVGFIQLNASAFGSAWSGAILAGSGALVVSLQALTMALDYVASQAKPPTEAG
jgi:hypothetical protein